MYIAIGPDDDIIRLSGGDAGTYRFANFRQGSRGLVGVPVVYCYSFGCIDRGTNGFLMQ
ncbi:hypothetical protein [Roseovarius spongiae]|uniref:hypothetical protein n=1 Tax=Roseovarius spongiae TaxID=2320272 RepID=UPI001409B447|nr:hypothetical protein [Roseovarius spongiae]